MAIFLAVFTHYSPAAPEGETVLAMVDKPYDLPPGIHKASAGKYRAFLGPFPSRLAAHYIWWLWARRGVKRLTTELIATAEQAARDEPDVLWAAEREAFLLQGGMTPEERADLYADLAAEYDPAVCEPIAVAWPSFHAQAAR